MEIDFIPWNRIDCACPPQQDRVNLGHPSFWSVNWDRHRFGGRGEFRTPILTKQDVCFEKGKKWVSWIASWIASFRVGL